MKYRIIFINIFVTENFEDNFNNNYYYHDGNGDDNDNDQNKYRRFAPARCASLMGCLGKEPVAKV